MLIYDNRPGEGEPPTPGLHVLVIGVSHYRHLPGGQGPVTTAAGLEDLKQLPTSARTAADLADWLITQARGGTLDVPLQSVRLMLSPSVHESGLPNVEPATYENIRNAVIAWRKDARRHRDGMTLFFASGHGVGGTLEDPILLPEDFADPAGAEGLFARVVSHFDLRGGMSAPDNPLETIAQRQIYIWDSCRNRPRAFREADWSSLPTIWDDDSAGLVGDRLLAEIFATVPDQLSYAGDPGERTLFGQALLECLDGAAAEAVPRSGKRSWCVGTTGILENLQERMDERNSALRTSQKFRPGVVMAIDIATWTAAPRVQVQLSVQPPERARHVGVTLGYWSIPPTETVINPVDPNPHPLDLPMGFYTVQVGATFSVDVALRPPRRGVVVDG